MKSILLKIPIYIVTLMVAVERVFACPACKDSFTRTGSNGSIGDAYSWSILFMLGVPVTIIATAIVVVARRLRQHPNTIS